MAPCRTRDTARSCLHSARRHRRRSRIDARARRQSRCPSAPHGAVWTPARASGCAMVHVAPIAVWGTSREREGVTLNLEGWRSSGGRGRVEIDGDDGVLAGVVRIVDDVPILDRNARELGQAPATLLVRLRDPSEPHRDRLLRHAELVRETLLRHGPNGTKDSVESARCLTSDHYACCTTRIVLAQVSFALVQVQA